ncbi:hypothetical protein N9O57_01580 [bacterium]|nr:hypothetical protein [bacterium]
MKLVIMFSAVLLFTQMASAGRSGMTTKKAKFVNHYVETTNNGAVLLEGFQTPITEMIEELTEETFNQDFIWALQVMEEYALVSESENKKFFIGKLKLNSSEITRNKEAQVILKSTLDFLEESVASINLTDDNISLFFLVHARLIQLKDDFSADDVSVETASPFLGQLDNIIETLETLLIEKRGDPTAEFELFLETLNRVALTSIDSNSEVDLEQEIVKILKTPGLFDLISGTVINFSIMLRNPSQALYERLSKEDLASFNENLKRFAFGANLLYSLKENGEKVLRSKYQAAFSQIESRLSDLINQTPYTTATPRDM